MIGRTIGQYQVIDKIGEGGMGSVYKAEDTTLHRLVALKALARSLSEDPEAKERFVREAQAASALNHPNITTVFELVQDNDDDSQLICMEYVEGKTIRDMVETGTVSVRKAIDIIMQAAEALEAAHNKGILHRDVKSANIMVSMEGRVKVMDFGLAHLGSRSQLTRTGTTMGTLSYSSPEQISGRPVDARSEIFSLGVVFYELLTGRLPFAATNEAELVFSIINNEPERLTQVREDVPDQVEAVSKKMLEKDPELRYQSCGEVINDLKGIRKEMETSTVSLTGTLDQNRASRKRTLIRRIGVAAALALILIAGALLLLPRGPQLDDDVAIVAIFENLTDDASLDHIGRLPVLMINRGLQRSQLLRPYPEQSTLQLNEQVAAAISESATSTDAGYLLARGAHAGYVITGQYWKQGDNLVIQSNVIDYTSSRRGVRIEGTEPITGPIDEVDTLLSELLDRTLLIIHQHLDPMGHWLSMSSSPASLQAMRLFSEALQTFSQDYEETLILAERALEADPTYIGPLTLMITTTHNLGLRGDGDWMVWYSRCDSLIQVAEERYDEMSPTSQSWVTDLKGWLLGDRQASYRAATEVFTNTFGSAYEAGLNAVCINRPEEAIGYFKQIDWTNAFNSSWISSWTEYAAALYMLGRFREAQRVIRHGQDYHPDNNTLLGWEARLLAARGRISALDRLLTETLQIAPTSSWLPTYPLLYAAQVLQTTGRNEQAQDVLDRALAWMDGHPGEREAEASRGHYALLLFMAGRLDEAQSVYGELLADLPDDRPDNVVLMGRYGTLLAAQGEEEAARSMMEKLAQVSGLKYRKGVHTYWRAAIAAWLGERDEAMQLLLQAEAEGLGFGSGLFYTFELTPLRDYPPFQNWLEPRG